MSHILDALKKLESEKIRKNRSSGMVNLSGELFRDEQKTASAWSGRRIAAVMLVVCLVTFAGTFFLLKGEKQVGKEVRDVEQHTPKVVQPAVLPAQPTPAPAPAVPPAAPVVASSVAEPVAKGKETKAPKLPKPMRKVQPPQLPQAKAKSKTPVRHEVAPAVMVPPPADIKVSGIAWQDERGARRSVVNGSLLQEGSVVAGAKITEILPDRVRFSQAGKTFEITLLASGLPGPGK